MTFTIKLATGILAFVSGIILCNVNIYIAGYLAAVPVPREYFLLFGHHYTVAFFILNLVTFVLPILLIAVVWSILANLLLRGQLRLTAIWCATGCIVAMLDLTFADSAATAEILATLIHPAPLIQFLVNLLAAPIGIMVGVILLSKIRQRERELLAS